jgi:hypothetical protein
MSRYSQVSNQSPRRARNYSERIIGYSASGFEKNRGLRCVCQSSEEAHDARFVGWTRPRPMAHGPSRTSPQRWLGTMRFELRAAWLIAGTLFPPIKVATRPAGLGASDSAVSWMKLYECRSSVISHWSSEAESDVKPFTTSSRWSFSQRDAASLRRLDPGNAVDVLAMKLQLTSRVEGYGTAYIEARDRHALRQRSITLFFTFQLQQVAI